MAGFNPYGGTRGPQFKLPDWLTGNYGKPNYYEEYRNSRKRPRSGGGGGVGRGAAAATAPAVLIAPTPVSIPAGTVQTGTIVKGVTPAGELDYSQGDEYKSQMAQYQNLVNQKKTQEAEDLGMQIWMQKYGKSPMGQAGGVIGAYNPLLASMFPETKGFASTFATPQEEELAARDLGKSAQGEGGWTMESLNPLQAQAQQQAATAAQADKATTAGVKIPVRNRVQAFLYGGM